ncbi:MAG: hypothetical protein AAF845_13605 [Bacteroidota bacterium]
MTFALDNLTAILVGTTLLVALVFVQQRGQRHAIDAASQGPAAPQASAFLDGIARDVERMGAMDTASGTRGLSLRRAVGPDGETYTSRLSFPVLLSPEGGAASEVAHVTYEVMPTGNSVRLGGALRPTYRAVRSVSPRGASGHRADGGSGLLIDFDVEVTGPDGVVVVADPSIPEAPHSVHLTVVEAPAPQAGGRRATRSTPTRHTRTVSAPGARATGEGAPAATPNRF